MAIGGRTAGASAGGSTSLTPDLPASVGAGDMMVLFVGCKPYNATIADITGWTRLGTQQTNGTTGAGTDTGSVAWTVFYRAWQTGDTAPTVSITSGNSSLACINGYTKGATSLWATPTAYFGSDTSSGTGYSATASGSSGNITVDDYLLHCTVIAGNDADLNTPTISATSATFGTPAKSPDTNGSTNTGTDLRAGCAHSACASGTSSADAVVGWTLTAAQTGGSALVRLREIPPVTRSPSAGTLRTVGQTPTVNQTWSASPRTGALRFAGQTPTVDSGRGLETWRALGTGEIANPSRFYVLFYHIIPANNSTTADLQHELRKFAINAGLSFSDSGCGICHQLMGEGIALPGEIITGADSHTCTLGAFGAFATGVGATDMAAILASGSTWFRVPETIGLVLSGSLCGRAEAKDLALTYVSRLGMDGGTYCALEFIGDGVSSLSMDSRLTLCNLSVETGAKTGMFYADMVTRTYVQSFCGGVGGCRKYTLHLDQAGGLQFRRNTQWYGRALAGRDQIEK